MGPQCKLICVIGGRAFYVNFKKLAILLLLLTSLLLMVLLMSTTLKIQANRTRAGNMARAFLNLRSNEPAPTLCDNCFHYNHTDLIDPVNVCSGESEIFMVIMITTVPLATSARTAIRSTWASHTHNNTASVRHVFLFGRTHSKKAQSILMAESVKYGDIWQGDFDDNYYNLTMKVVGALKWTLRSCPQVKFIMRTADDCFINIPEVKYLYSMKANSLGKSLSGQCIGAVNKPIRKKNSRWYVTEEAYPRSAYPPYCIGTAFVLSRQFTIQFLTASRNVPFFKMEDVYFGLVIEYMKVNPINIPGFNMFWTLVRQVPNTLWYTLHYVKPEDMKSIWKIEKGRYAANMEFHARN